MPKKTVKKTTTKMSTKKNAKAIATATPELHEMHYGCTCTPMKKTFYLGGMFLLGFVIAHFAFCPCHRFENKIAKERPIFVNGCLDMDSIKCERMQEVLANADMDADGCISVSEFNAAKRIMHRGPRKQQVEE